MCYLLTIWSFFSPAGPFSKPRFSLPLFIACSTCHSREMCFSSSMSYATATILVITSFYTLRQGRHRQAPLLMLALVPLFFGIQQGFEGLVWQTLNDGRADKAVPYALVFHFFSHFLWMWWFPLCSYLAEYRSVRKKLFAAHTIVGITIGGLVYTQLLLHPEWLVVGVKYYSITYDISVPPSDFIDIPIPASAIYSFIILVPLLLSSHRHLRVFGVLVTASMILASLVYGYALVSVWCFFAAVLSLYLAYIIHREGRGSLPRHSAAV